MKQPPQNNWNAKDYAQHSSAQFKWAEDVIASMNLEGSEKILDIGCGDGKITASIARKYPKASVIGIDSSTDMITNASGQFLAAQYPNLTFQLMDASHITFDAKFDIVFSNAALHWIKDHQPVLNGVYRCLKPGGKCYLSFGGNGNGDALIEAIHTVIDQPKWSPYFKQFEEIWAFHNADDYRQWVIDAGLMPITISLTPKPAVFPDKDGLVGYLRTAWHQYNRYLPEEQLNPFASDVVDEYLTRHPHDAQNQISVTMVRLEVVAEKPK